MFVLYITKHIGTEYAYKDDVAVYAFDASYYTYELEMQDIGYELTFNREEVRNDITEIMEDFKSYTDGTCDFTIGYSDFRSIPVFYTETYG